MNNFDIKKLLNELKFNFSRSGGKGGQNVNKVETKVELIFNLQNTLTLDDELKKRLISKLHKKLDKEGNLRVVSQTERTQMGNRKKALQKFEAVINNALREEKKRVKTTQSISSKLKRLESKRKHSEKKRERRKTDSLLD